MHHPLMTEKKLRPEPIKQAETQSRIRLVAIDLDGTLLRTDKRLSKLSYKVIRSCVERGVKVVIASARPPRSVKPVYEALELDTLSIHYNGALIHNLRRKRNVFHQPMTPDTVRRIIRLARRVDSKCIISLEILDKWYTDHYDPQLMPETGRTFQPDFVGPLEAFLTVAVTKLMILAPPPRLKKLISVIEKRFASKVNITISDEHLMQLMHREVDKSVALARVADGYGIARAKVMAIGDAPNDSAMLRWAGLGVAMGNAWARTRLAADVVVPSNDDNGVAHALQKYVLNGKR